MAITCNRLEEHIKQLELVGPLHLPHLISQHICDDVSYIYDGMQSHIDPDYIIPPYD